MAIKIINPLINTVDPTLQEKTITENGEYVADEGYDGLSKVKVNVESGASFNIHYGLNPPEDTSMLWVETESEPSRVMVAPQLEGETQEVVTLSEALSEAAGGITCAAVGTKIYLFGGATSGGRLDAISRFDTETQKITTLTEKLSEAVVNKVCAAVGTKIYLFSGYNGSTGIRTVQCFDTETERIETLFVSLPDARYNVVCAAVGTKIYLFGGNLSSGGGSTKSNTIYYFNTLTNTFTTLSQVLPNKETSCGCAAVGEKIYLFGGDGSSGSLDEIKYFNTLTEGFRTLSEKLPETQYNFSAAVVGKDIYLFGGRRPTTTNAILRFDTETERIETLSATLPTEAYGIACASVGTKIYLFGGNPSSGKLDTINCFDTAPAFTAAGTLRIIPQMEQIEENMCRLINSDTATLMIGVSRVFIGSADNVAEQVNAYLYDEATGEWKLIE